MVVQILFNILKNKKLSNTNLNNNNHRNRGVEVLLHGGKRKQIQPFHIIFEKIFCFLNREVTIYFEFSLTVKKRKTIPIGRKENVSS